MNLTYSTTTLAIAGAVTLLSGCYWGTNDEIGVLGDTRFSYMCVADTDPRCNTLYTGGSPMGLPDIAVGGRFQLTSSGKVSSASDGIVVDEPSGYFAAVSAGWSTMMSTQTTGPTEVDDLAYLRVAEPAGVKFVAIPRSPWYGGDGGAFVDFGAGGVSAGLHVSLDRSFAFGAYLVDAEGQMLAGAFPMQWSVDDPTVVVLDGSVGQGAMALRALAAGSTTVTVRIGAVSASFPIEVDNDE